MRERATANEIIRLGNTLGGAVQRLESLLRGKTPSPAVPKCGEACPDLVEGLCECCELTVKGADCPGVGDCLAALPYAESICAECEWQEPGQSRADYLADQADIHHASGDVFEDGRWKEPGS